MSTYDLVAGLPLEIEEYALDGRELKLTEEFTRATTVIRLRGGGQEGAGEDVTYDVLDHVALQDAGPALPLAGSYTFGSFSERLEELDLWPAPPVREPSIDYRRWAYESAALDLALRQAGKSLADAVGRELRPLTYVVSMRLGAFGSDEPDNTDRLKAVLGRYPQTRFKLDPTNSWTPALIQELVETGAVDSLDLKGQYKGTPVDVDTDPELYRQVAEAFPDAWLEDPDITDETDRILEPYRDRITWDAPIHSMDDVDALPFAPRMINIKPSRFGPISRLFHAYDECERRGISAYGGGQTELDVGRGHIQYLAALFHPDTPNDVAPGGFNLPEPPDGMPSSPMDPRPAATGFRWSA